MKKYIYFFTLFGIDNDKNDLIFSDDYTNTLKEMIKIND